MTLYLTESTTRAEILEASAEGIVAAKLYPAGATTNSASGVQDIRNIYPVLEAMAECGMLLLVHGEVTDADIDILIGKRYFLSGFWHPRWKPSPTLKL